YRRFSNAMVRPRVRYDQRRVALRSCETSRLIVDVLLAKSLTHWLAADLLVCPVSGLERLERVPEIRACRLGCHHRDAVVRTTSLPLVVPLHATRLVPGCSVRPRARGSP